MTMTESYDRILSRRTILSGFAATTCALFANQRIAEAETRLYRRSRDKAYPLFDEATANVIPAAGFQSQISLHDSIVRLVSNGVIDREKFLALQQYNGALPPELLKAMDKPSDRPIHLTRENASHYVNLLWPAGLSNHLNANKESPLVGPDLPNFASTGDGLWAKNRMAVPTSINFPSSKLNPGKKRWRCALPSQPTVHAAAIRRFSKTAITARLFLQSCNWVQPKGSQRKNFTRKLWHSIHSGFLAITSRLRFISKLCARWIGAI